MHAAKLPVSPSVRPVVVSYGHVQPLRQSATAPPPPPKPALTPYSQLCADADEMEIAAEQDDAKTAVVDSRSSYVRNSIGVSSLKRKLGCTPDDAEFLRSMILKARSGHRQSDEVKHFYDAQGFNIGAWATQPELTFSLLNVPTGPQLNNRLTNKICMKYLRMRFNFSILPSSLAAGTQSVVWPQITIIVYREKLPVQPGVPSSMWNVPGTNPPSATTNGYFDTLGLATTPGATRVAVVNPAVRDRFHLYKVHHLESQNWGGGANVTQIGGPSGGWGGTQGTVGVSGCSVVNYSKTVDFHIPLNDVQVQYSGSGTAAPCENAINLSVYNDNGSTANSNANGCDISWTYSADFSFVDVQV